MSIPRNHHYVSQVLIKKFLNPDKRISTFSKKENKVVTKLLERQDFAERDLNSFVTDENVIDHKSVEDNLNANFERDFNKYYNLLFQSIENINLELFIKSIKSLIKLGVIGDMRTREYQLETQQIIYGKLGEIIEIFSEETKIKNNDNFDDLNPSIKNKLPLNFNKTANEVLELIGDASYCVFKAHENHHFFLPDNTSLIQRSKTTQNIKMSNGKTLVRSDLPITIITYPIDNKNMIVVKSKKTKGLNSNGIFQLSELTTINYNLNFIRNSRDKIISGEENYLKKFIKNYINQQ